MSVLGFFATIIAVLGLLSIFITVIAAIASGASFARTNKIVFVEFFGTIAAIVAMYLIF
jgi:hypothetical protein